MRQFYTRYPYSLFLKAILQFFVTLFLANLGNGSASFSGVFLFVLALAPTSFLLIDLLVLPSLGVRAANLADWVWGFFITILYRSLGYLQIGFFQLLVVVTGIATVEHFFHQMLKNAAHSD